VITGVTKVGFPLSFTFLTAHVCSPFYDLLKPEALRQRNLALASVVRHVKLPSKRVLEAAELAGVKRDTERMAPQVGLEST
jgi:hypothetical protein